MKLSGAEYSAFMSADWDVLLGKKECYVDDVGYTLNGVDVEDVEGVKLTDKVEMHGGCVYSGDHQEVCSPATAFKKWKQQQTHSVFVCTIPNDKGADFSAYVKSIGGKTE